MDELERMGRAVWEQLRQVGEGGLGRAWEALQPLIQQLLARLEALNIVLRFLTDLFLLLWVQAQAGPALDAATAGALHQTMVDLVLLGVAALLTLVTLGVVIAVVANRKVRRQAEAGQGRGGASGA